MNENLLLEVLNELAENQQVILTLLKSLNIKLNAKEIVDTLKEEDKKTHFAHVESEKGWNLEADINPPIKKAYPGVPNEESGVLEYQKNDGTVGHKLSKDAIFEDKFYKYVQPCKYGCGHWISFDNYTKGMKALHIDKDTLKAIGRFCPKYE